MFYEKHLDGHLLLQNVRLIPLHESLALSINSTLPSLQDRHIALPLHTKGNSPDEDYREQIIDAEDVAKVYQRTGIFFTISEETETPLKEIGKFATSGKIYAQGAAPTGFDAPPNCGVPPVDAITPPWETESSSTSSSPGNAEDVRENLTKKPFKPGSSHGEKSAATSTNAAKTQQAMQHGL
ncbi:hypothetical protein C0991_009908 [Blastosporella zonata]|nr:hypothetical protein C0991_009908 [Blastosporella zonata]